MRISGVGIARAGKKIRGQIDKKDKQFEHNSLKETVKEQKIEKAISIYERTQQELADAIGVTRVRINEIILGKRSVTPDTAFRLAKFFNTTAEFWMGLQTNYDMWETLQSNKTEYAQINPLKKKVA